jgi:hypothetical protein
MPEQPGQAEHPAHAVESSRPTPRHRPSGRRRALASGGVLALAAGVAAAASTFGADPGATGGPVGTLGTTAPVSFRTFDNCSSLLAYYRSNGQRLVTAYGLPGSGPMMAIGAAERRLAVADAPAAASPAPGPAGSPDTTSAGGTNV